MNISRSLIPILMVTALAASSCSSSRRLTMSSSPDIPAVQSKVKVGTTDNGNTSIQLEVEHLASPDRVSPEATVYVVWARGNETGAYPVNLGALTVDGNLKGSLVTVTPLRAFDLYVTAEPSQASTTPTGKTLLRTTVAMK